MRDSFSELVGLVDAGSHQDVSLLVVLGLHVDGIVEGVGKDISVGIFGDGGLDGAGFRIDDRDSLGVKGPELTALDVLVDLVSVQDGAGWSEEGCCRSQELGRSVHPRASHGE